MIVMSIRPCYNTRVTENNFVEVSIDSIRVSLMSQQRIVVLREKDGERHLPIWIGPYEAEAITVALQEVEVSRPLTHDLLNNVFRTLNARLLRVEVTSLREDVYYGKILAEVNGMTVEVDSRPSDAIALAVRAHIPIFVERAVIENAGILPEENIVEEFPAGAAAPGDEPQEVTEDEGTEARLSVFEDFLDKLDNNDGEEDSEEE